MPIERSPQEWCSTMVVWLVEIDIVPREQQHHCPAVVVRVLDMPYWQGSRVRLGPPFPLGDAFILDKVRR